MENLIVGILSEKSETFFIVMHAIIFIYLLMVSLEKEIRRRMSRNMYRNN